MLSAITHSVNDKDLKVNNLFIPYSYEAQYRTLRGFFENTIVMSTTTSVASAALRCIEQTGGPTSYFLQFILRLKVRRQ